MYPRPVELGFNVIGITGYKRTGKTTFARAIKNQHKNTFIYSFAKPLKEICHILFGGCEDHWYGDMKADVLTDWQGKLPFTAPTPRVLMQYVGTEMFREQLGAYFWTHVARRYIMDAYREEGFSLCVIDDVRFDSEAEFLIQEFDATIVKLNRVDEAAEAAGINGHASERGIKQAYIDYVYSYVPNNINQHDDFAKDLLNRLA